MAKKFDGIKLKRREAKCTNLNYQPERAGDDLVPRVDLSLEFLLEPDEIDGLVQARGNVLQALWDKDGDPMFLHLHDFELDLVAEGQLLISHTASNEALDFDAAKLKKIHVTPHLDRRALISCQIRIDPGTHLDELGDIRLHERCSIEYQGKPIKQKTKSGDDPDDNKGGEQKRLGV